MTYTLPLPALLALAAVGIGIVLLAIHSLSQEVRRAELRPLQELDLASRTRAPGPALGIGGLSGPGGRQARLETISGDYVATVAIPPIKGGPQIILWGSRFFYLNNWRHMPCLIAAGRADKVLTGVYREVFAYAAVDTLDAVGVPARARRRMRHAYPGPSGAEAVANGDSAMADLAITRGWKGTGVEPAYPTAAKIAASAMASPKQQVELEAAVARALADETPIELPGIFRGGRAASHGA